MIDIDNKKMDLNLLFVFYEIYKFNSVTKAALSLEISQSAVSHSLKKLREIFSDELFVRSGNKILPTNKANKIFNQLEPLINLLRENIYKTLEFHPEKSKREFKVAMTDISEIIMLPRVLNYFLEHEFNLKIKVENLNLENINQDLNEGKVDIAVGSFTHVHPDLYRKRLFEHEFVAVEYSGDDQEEEHCLTFDEYLERKHVIVSSSSDNTFTEIALTPYNKERSNILTINNYLPLPWLLYENKCIATIPNGLSKIFSNQVKLKTYRLDWFNNEFSVDMLWSSRVNKDPAIFWLVNLIYDLMSDVRNKVDEYKNIF